jgi:hypothetical protein
VEISPDIRDKERPQRLRAVYFLLLEGTGTHPVQNIIDFLLLLKQIRHLSSIEQVIDTLQKLFIKDLGIHKEET